MENGRLAALKVMRLEDGSAFACAGSEEMDLAARLDCCLSLEVTRGSRISLLWRRCVSSDPAAQTSACAR